MAAGSSRARSSLWRAALTSLLTATLTSAGHRAVASPSQTASPTPPAGSARKARCIFVADKSREYRDDICSEALRGLPITLMRIAELEFEAPRGLELGDRYDVAVYLRSDRDKPVTFHTISPLPADGFQPHARPPFTALPNERVFLGRFAGAWREAAKWPRIEMAVEKGVSCRFRG